MNPDKLEALCIEITAQLRYNLDTVRFSRNLDDLYDNLESFKDEIESAVDDVQDILHIESMNEE